jgi:small subunit ribosomal protein S1
MTNEINAESLPTPEISPEPLAEPIPEPANEPVAPAAEAPVEPAPAPAVEAGAPGPSHLGTRESQSSEPAAEEPSEPQESFADLLNAFESSHSHKSEPGQRQLQGTVVSLSADQVFLDIGYKTEGVLPRSAFLNNAEDVHPGDTFPVSVTGRNTERYYELSRFKVAQPRDWSALEAAFAEKLAIVGTVTEVRKGGVTVDVGVRAFMPASRSGTKDAVELEKLIGTEITCRITKLDVMDEDVVVDRRVVLEEQARGLSAARRDELKEGAIVTGTVSTLMPYGAFINIGGFDGLLHVSDISHARIAKPEDVLAVGQELQLKILKIDPATQKISLGLKQLQPEPWQTISLAVNQRVTGTVTRLTDFGAFVEIEPGIEGLIHISEMSYGKKLRHPSDLLKQGARVEVVILGIKPEERRISLGLKQTLADPWTDAVRTFPVGSQITGPVTKLMNFGAFVELADGIEGLVHISEITAERRLNHPSEMLREGQIVKAQILAIDPEKRQIKLSIKQLIPTEIDEYIAEHKVGDIVSGRVIEQSISLIHVELGDGIRAICHISSTAAIAAESAPAAGAQASPQGSAGALASTQGSAAAPAAPQVPAKLDLSSLSSQLKNRWKGHTPAASAQPDAFSEGQIRSFKITKMDAEYKKIEVELA